MSLFFVLFSKKKYREWAHSRSTLLFPSRLDFSVSMKSRKMENSIESTSQSIKVNFIKNLVFDDRRFLPTTCASAHADEARARRREIIDQVQCYRWQNFQSNCFVSVDGSLQALISRIALVIFLISSIICKRVKSNYSNLFQSSIIVNYVYQLSRL